MFSFRITLRSTRQHSGFFGFLHFYLTTELNLLALGIRFIRLD